MEFRDYTIAGKTVRVTNPRIISIVKKAESIESLDKFHEAQRELKEYLLGDDCMKYLSIGDYMTNLSLWETISVESFDALGEKYVRKFKLSGSFTPEDERKKTEAWLNICNENAQKTQNSTMIVRYDGPIGNAARGISKHKREPP